MQLDSGAATFAQSLNHSGDFGGRGFLTEGGEVVADRALIIARAVLNDHAGGNLFLLQNQPEQSPPGQCDHRIETPGEGGAFVVDVGSQWCAERQSPLVVGEYL